MSCSSSTPFSFDVQFFHNTNCFDCGCGDNGCGNNIIDSKCIMYTGPNLSCSGGLTNESVETILQKLDTQVCSAIGDYSTYQFNCLDDWFGQSITTEAQFVQAITEYICELREDLDAHTDTTFTDYQTVVNARFDALEVPAITCTTASVVPSDTLQQVLTKFCAKFGAIDDSLDLSSVVWNACLAVSPLPTTIPQGFQTLADQICSLEGDVQPLPTFNNIGSCLASPGSSETLVATIEKIKTRLCLTPTFNNDHLTASCVTVPSTDLDLEGLLQQILNKIDTLTQTVPTFDAGDFDVSALGGPCDGVSVSLQTPINQDRFVAVSNADSSPGTLFSKLSAPSSSITITNVADTTVGVAISTGDKGDIVVSGGGNTWTIDTGVVSFAKMQTINTQRVLGRSTASLGAVEELSIGSNMSLAGGILNTAGRTLIGVTTFTSSGTWTKPTGCNAVIVITIGAGGGGGGGTSVTAEAVAGSGGGAGSHQNHYITSGLSSTVSVTIGSGGAGGNSGTSYNGASGGASSFGGFTDAGGGFGGVGMVSGTTGAITLGGAAGAQGANPTYQVYGGTGSDGSNGLRLSGTVAAGGKGGASIFGGGGNEYSPGSGGDGRTALNGSSTDGYNGTGGIVIVYELS